jgi:ribosome maturation factor RimP
MLEAEIDAQNWFGEKYVLEVSSAGVDRPLTDKRQYRKNLGRKIEIQTVDDKKIKGIFEDYTDEEIIVKYNHVRKEGKKKIKEELTEKVPLRSINKLKVKASF